MGYKTIQLKENLNEVIDQRLKKKSTEMMNHLKALEWYANRLGQLGISPYIYALCAKTSGGGSKPFCRKIVWYENCFYFQDEV